MKALLQKASLEALPSPASARIASALMERLGLQPAVVELESLAARVAEVEGDRGQLIKDVARARIALSFAHEARRIDERVNLLQVTLDKAAVAEFHADIVLRDHLPLTEGLASRSSRLGSSSGLNVAPSPASTAGASRWPSASRPRSAARTSSSCDGRSAGTSTGACSKSYLGARGDKGSWAATLSSGTSISRPT